MKHFLIVALGCITAFTAFAQWPTSTQTANALVLNYGFSARAVTFDDGSVIFSHGLPNSVYVTKLSADGYRMWGQQPVIAHYNDSSAFSGGAAIVSDGANGAIVSWNDYRGALFNPATNDYYNNARYMQKVDSNGIVRWQAGGVLAIGPETGLKGGSIVTDGAGGVIYVTSERGFGYPGAPNRERLVAVRIGQGGQKLWEVTLDSSAQRDVIFFDDVVRAGKFFYIRFLDYRSGTLQYRVRIVDTTGTSTETSTWSGFSSNRSWRDSILYSLSYPSGGNRIKKIGSMGDSVWSVTFPTPGGCQSPSPFSNTIIPFDGLGGIYFIRGCRDTVLHLRGSDGHLTWSTFNGMDSIGGHLFPDGGGGVLVASVEGIAQRFDSSGSPVWGTLPVVYQNDPENSEFENFWGDNNGGVIASFWTPSRGLSVQHTGRFGQPGIVPVTESGAFGGPLKVYLAQNFPNPFNTSTTLSFDLPEPSIVSLMVYDVLGRKVAELAEGSFTAGTHTAIWNAADQASGVYFARITLASGVGQAMYSKINKLILMK